MAFEQTRSFLAMGTVNSVTVMNEGLGGVLDSIEKRISGLDDKLSVFKPDSEISRINAAAGGKPVKAGPDTKALLTAAKRYSLMSGGAFSVTTRPLTRLWREAAQRGILPSEEEIGAAKSLVNDEDIVIGDDGIALRREGQAIDLGGIAKGYAADLAADMLREAGAQEAVINFGGTVICLGPEKTVGIQHPRKMTGIPMGRLKVSNMAVVTSGDYERFYEIEGERHHHIIDPRTGVSSDSGLYQVTLTGKSAMEADALSTAIFVLGAHRGERLAQLRDMETIFVTDKLDVYFSRGLKDRFSLEK